MPGQSTYPMFFLMPEYSPDGSFEDSDALMARAADRLGGDFFFSRWMADEVDSAIWYGMEGEPDTGEPSNRKDLYQFMRAVIGAVPPDARVRLSCEVIGDQSDFQSRVAAVDTVIMPRPAGRAVPAEVTAAAIEECERRAEALREAIEAFRAAQAEVGELRAAWYRSQHVAIAS